MKKILTLAAVAVAALTSCKKTEPDDLNPELLIGRWDMTSDVSWVKADGEYTHGPTTITGEEDYFSIELERDGTLLLRNAEDEEPETADWSLADKTLTFDNVVYQGDMLFRYTFQIVQLTEENLVFETYESAEYEGTFHEQYKKLAFKKRAN
jgi:hypothetical protein